MGQYMEYSINNAVCFCCKVDNQVFNIYAVFTFSTEILTDVALVYVF